MAKQSGLGDQLYASGYRLSGDINALGKVGGGHESLDMTGIDKSAFERKAGIRDGSFEMTCLFNPGPAADAAHLRLSVLPTTSQHLMYTRGSALGAPAACMLGKQLNYDGERGSDGALTFEVEAELSDGIPLEWAELVTPGVRQDTAATNGAALDEGAATNFGLSLHVHLLAFTGTSCTVKLQESSDAGAGDAWVDVVGATTGALSAIGAVRVATATNLTVERYLRLVTTGTFSVANIVAAVYRNPVAVT